LRRFDSRALLFNGALAAAVGGGAAALLWGRADLPPGAWAAPLGIGALWVLWRMRRWGRRLRAGDEPPPAVTRALERHVYFYQRLPAQKQARFRQQVHWFLLDQTITGVGVEATDELRALVAASAIVLSFGLPDFEWDNTRDILLYPSAFDETYRHDARATRLGQVSRQGPVIFSAPALRAGFAQSADGHNVGFHEFAHVLDFKDGEVDGVLAHLNWEAIRPWVDLMGEHMQRRDKQGRRTQILRDYGYTHEAEFLACATEMFFERPALLRRRAPQLYDLLRDFYGQDLLLEEG
jgi:Mlc titration factor MtfA (ptsG expression regulator)